jgi:predicted transglutaminase-like cysteine proteinase
MAGQRGVKMGFYVHAHALRAAVLACGLVCSIPAPHAVAGTLLTGTLETSASLGLSSGAAEPFGLSATPVHAGGMFAKWEGVARKIDDDRVQLALCDGDRERCVSDAALKLLAIIDLGRAREGRARLGEINRAINLAIRSMSDLAQFGEVDVWSSPLDTFRSGAGDCEDYAIAKYVALRMAGIPADDLRIVVMADMMRGEGHAVTAVRLDGHWLMLDNERMAMVEDLNVRHYRPLFVIDDTGLKRYSDAPLLAKLPEPDPARSASAAPAPQPRLIAASD